MNNLDSPAEEQPAKKLMVMLHGLGSNGEDLLSLSPFIASELPDYHFYAPNAIEPYDMAPFGYQWFSFQNRDKEAILPFIEPAAKQIRAIIYAKQQELNLTNKDTIILGFSQGAMMGTYVTLTADQPFAASIAVSGRIFAPDVLYPDLAININTKTPICIVHGKGDRIVPYELANETALYCQKHNISSELHLFSNLEHSIDARGLSAIVKFLQKHT